MNFLQTKNFILHRSSRPYISSLLDTNNSSWPIQQHRRKNASHHARYHIQWTRSERPVEAGIGHEVPNKGEMKENLVEEGEEGGAILPVVARAVAKNGHDVKPIWSEVADAIVA